MNLNDSTQTGLCKNRLRHTFQCLSGTLRIYGVLCLGCVLFASVAAAGAVDPNTRVDPENDLLLAKNPTTESEHQLWKARMSTTGDAETSQSKNDLKSLMQQINSIKFKELEPVPEAPPEPAVEATAPLVAPLPIEEPAAAVEPVVETEPNDVAAPEASASEPSVGHLSPQTLEMFRELLKKPEQLKKPFELGEVLFRGRYPKEAAICYQIAFDRMADVEEDPHYNKAWILFQLGNCLEDVSPEEALEKYRILMTEYSDCPWVDVARVKSRVIDWRLKDNPVGLIEACKL